VISSVELIELGFAIQDGFRSVVEVAELAECAQARRARGEFAAAHIGTGQTLQHRKEIRGDFTCWLNEPLYAPEARLLESFEQLRLTLNRDAFLGLLDLELHYAFYPPGAHYARHVDQPRGRMRRKLSVVLYLNTDWEADAGGELRLFMGAKEPVDVQPLGGRLVSFLTAGREHCVLPAHRERLSVTGWFGTRV
jgi:SM-20-related protein